VLIRDHNPGVYYEYWTPKGDEKVTTQSPLITSTAFFHPSAVATSQTVLQTTIKVHPTDDIKGELDDSQPKHLPDTKQTQNKISQNHEYKTKTNEVKPDSEILRKDILNNSLNISQSKRNHNKNKSKDPSSHNRIENEVLKKPLHPDKPKKKKKKKKPKPFGNPNKKKKKKGKTKLPVFCNSYVCKRPKKAKENFCTSDFVSRVEVLSSEEWIGERRYEVLVHQSYKNIIPLMHKEFLWLDNPCNCPRLRTGRTYILMGNTAVTRGREVRFVLGSGTYVTKYNTKNLAKIIKIRNNQQRHCRPWRRSLRRLHLPARPYSNHTVV
ncbi:unnamed protein product, partial [Meganyctiphanes norvegica]